LKGKGSSGISGHQRISDSDSDDKGLEDEDPNWYKKIGNNVN
jgi:hypothetical protein